MGNIHSPEVVDRGSETQLQLVEFNFFLIKGLILRVYSFKIKNSKLDSGV